MAPNSASSPVRRWFHTAPIATSTSPSCATLRVARLVCGLFIKAKRHMARLLLVNVGLPRDIEWKGRIVHTGIWKNPVHGRCRVGRLNLDGDGQGDLGGHGGEQRAVFVYQIESYRHWQQQLKRTDFVHGQFGENFTIEGLPDDIVCIGDRFQIGSPSSRSHSQASPAAASAFGPMNRGCRSDVLSSSMRDPGAQPPRPALPGSVHRLALSADRR